MEDKLFGITYRSWEGIGIAVIFFLFIIVGWEVWKRVIDALTGG